MMFSGVYVPLITPFDATGEVATGALAALAHEMLDAGAAGLVALGTTGEPGSLTAAEQQSVLEVVARVCREHDAQLIVGASAAGTVGAASLSLVPPFVRPGEDGVVAYFEALAQVSPMPVIVYHVPYRTGQGLSAATIRRLAAIPQVAGIKLAAGGIDATVIELMADLPPDFAVLGGDDAFLSPLLALGAHGGILACAHLAPAQFVALVAAWQAGDLGRARALGHDLAGLALAAFAGPNPTVIKAALHAQGRIPTPGVRLPLLAAQLSDSCTAAISRVARASP